eukprot:c31010_g1_i1 orf=112-492(+)
MDVLWQTLLQRQLLVTGLGSRGIYDPRVVQSLDLPQGMEKTLQGWLHNPKQLRNRSTKGPQMPLSMLKTAKGLLCKTRGLPSCSWQSFKTQKSNCQRGPTNAHVCHNAHLFIPHANQKSFPRSTKV